MSYSPYLTNPRYEEEEEKKKPAAAGSAPNKLLSLQFPIRKFSKSYAMASSSPPPSDPSPHPSSNSSSRKVDYYYFVVGLALVAIILLVTNAIAVGCCASLRQFMAVRGWLSRGRSEEEMRRWIPAFKYRKKEQGVAGGEEGEAAPECAVCLSAFDEGEEVRQLPACGHSFHADCIDMWLNSHSSCPVCRGSVVPTPSHSMELSAQFHSQVNLIAGAEAAGGGDEEGVGGSV